MNEALHKGSSESRTTRSKDHVKHAEWGSKTQAERAFGQGVVWKEA